MDLNQLKEYLNNLANNLENGDRKFLKNRLESLSSVFPFSEYEYMLMFFRDRGIITFCDYEILRNSYINSNKNLQLYGLAPRIFGQIWGEQHIISLDNRFKKPDKTLDPEFNNQYDLWIEGIKLEVKASRAINTKKRGSILSKAISYNSNEPFWMNFQQLKPNFCNAFIFIGVWIDKIVYWVLLSEEVRENKHFSHQHTGGIEYQIGITNKNINEFDIYKVDGTQMADIIIQKYKFKDKLRNAPA